MYEPSEHRPTQVIVDLNAIQHNIQYVQTKMSEEQLLYVTVKADAYGHGAIPVAKAAIEAGAKGLLVATVDEAIELRQNGFSQIPILVLGLTDPRGIAEILHYNITITVSSHEFFARAYEQLVATNQLNLLDVYVLNVHLALDTGMGRIGLRSVEEVREFALEIQQYAWVNWQGVFTHFATAGGGPEAYVEKQFDRWKTLIEAVPESVTYRHYANTAMAIWHHHLQPKSDIVRLGISMYGMDPKDERDNIETATNLQPVMQLISEIMHTKQVGAGESISYGAQYTTTESEWVATVPIGYADGWLRRYHVIDVLVAGHRCPVVGVINMDQMMIKLPHNLPVGTTVTLIGKDGKFENHVSDMARQLDTISYEIFCNISRRVPRIYLKD
ncbi:MULTISPECIES: alanine racemase [unclassified Facklamia]|uniref:alanine racemase n=1 Tax=Aerococcaceae TaxID=186827 RepID=UPI0013BB8334|nr:MULTISPECIES: alanine racemase [unclassified Facklamia]MBS4461730.1 alanine racemase [Aerococcaceae bacterium zg-B36]NEW64018.1 alanine racemase [Facklamia sp. 252]NEW67489.1 alanine racemase [Facklamia sp. 253]QQD65362.1 alanine racemase [Aerococcaceae bacterium zg-252]